MQRVIFLVLPRIEILDLAGPLQVFSDANSNGAAYEIVVCGPGATVTADQGLSLTGLKPLVEVSADDLVFVPGLPLVDAYKVKRDILKWLQQAHSVGARICSVCTGAFVLARAGLLDGRVCTTHWMRTEDLQLGFPQAQVVSNRLFVEDRNIITSAGVVAGIDLALWLVEQKHGPRLSAAVARQMVVYLRRDGSQKQESVYLDYRAHLHPGVHRVQDTISNQPGQRWTLGDLANIANMSERNLTRVFRQATGISIGDYIGRLRLELARSLLSDPELSIEGVAARCGFQSGRQLRRAWKKAFGVSASAFRGSRNGL